MDVVLQGWAVLMWSHKVNPYQQLCGSEAFEKPSKWAKEGPKDNSRVFNTIDACLYIAHTKKGRSVQLFTHIRKKFTLVQFSDVMNCMHNGLWHSASIS